MMSQRNGKLRRNNESLCVYNVYIDCQLSYLSETRKKKQLKNICECLHF